MGKDTLKGYLGVVVLVTTNRTDREINRGYVGKLVGYDSSFIQLNPVIKIETSLDDPKKAARKYIYGVKAGKEKLVGISTIAGLEKVVNRKF
jgi:hypothetical protein